MVPEVSHPAKTTQEAGLVIPWHLIPCFIVSTSLEEMDLHKRLTASFHHKFRDSTVDVGRLNDLWMFNISSRQWTWLSGNNTAEIIGPYGTKGIPSINNYPSSRDGHSMVYFPAQHSIYIFGGAGYTQIDAQVVKGESIYFSYYLTRRLRLSE